MNEGKVTIERRGHRLLIGLDRVPKRNAFDVAMYHDLATAYGTLDRDQDLRCGVLFAHGDHFTAGIDLAQWLDNEEGFRRTREQSRLQRRQVVCSEGRVNPQVRCQKACGVVFARIQLDADVAPSHRSR